MLTNKQNLPQLFVDLAKREPREIIANRYSCTELLSSPREIYIARHYPNDYEEDVADTINTLIGTALHSYFEQHTTGNVKTEIKWDFKVNDATIVCKSDAIDETTKTIRDYKTCTTSKITSAKFDDDKLQGLIYAYGYYKTFDVKIEHLEFINVIKDHSKIKASTSPNYPQSPIYVWKYDIQDSDYLFIEDWLKTKLQAINEYQPTELCSIEDRWNTGDKYAVYKNVDDAKAKIVCDTEQEANDYIANKLNGVGTIQKREGEDLKCKLYCKWSKVCKKLNYKQD